MVEGEGESAGGDVVEPPPPHPPISKTRAIIAATRISRLPTCAPRAARADRRLRGVSTLSLLRRRWGLPDWITCRNNRAISASRESARRSKGDVARFAESDEAAGGI